MMVSPAQHDCWLRWRELLPLAGILDIPLSSVHLDIEIFQYCVKMVGSVLYSTNNRYDSYVMGRTLTTGDKVWTHFALMTIKFINDILAWNQPMWGDRVMINIHIIKRQDLCKYFYLTIWSLTWMLSKINGY